MKTTYSNDTKYQFLQLRARGTSLGHISQQLGVPKSTLSDWDKQHRDEIHHLRAIEWEMLEEQFGRTIQHDLKAMAARIRKWETELDNLDPGYEDVPTMLKVLRETRREYFRLRDIIMAPIERADLGIVNRFSFSWANTVTAAHENATSNSPVTPDLRAKPRCKTESNSRGLTSCDTSTNEDPPSADAVPDSLPSDAEIGRA